MSSFAPMISLLGEVSECQVFVADHESDLTLMRLAAHSSAEASKLAEPVGIADVGGRGVAVKDHGLILDQRAAHFVIPPDSLGTRESSGSAKQLPECFERG